MNLTLVLVLQTALVTNGLFLTRLFYIPCDFLPLVYRREQVRICHQLFLTIIDDCQIPSTDSVIHSINIIREGGKIQHCQSRCQSSKRTPRVGELWIWGACQCQSQLVGINLYISRYVDDFDTKVFDVIDYSSHKVTAVRIQQHHRLNFRWCTFNIRLQPVPNESTSSWLAHPSMSIPDRH